MDKRRIAPTFMLPEEFPNQEVKDIFVVYRGGLHNVHIVSAQEFAYTGMSIASGRGQNKGTQVTYRIDNVADSILALDDLAQLNDGFVDWTMVLEQGQRAHYALKEQMQGPNRIGGMEEIIRFTKQGELYLPRKE